MDHHDHDDDADTLGPVANPARWYHYAAGALVILYLIAVCLRYA